MLHCSCKEEIEQKHHKYTYSVHYSTEHYSTVQYSTVQYSTVQYRTVEYSIHSTVEYKPLNDVAAVNTKQIKALK